MLYKDDFNIIIKGREVTDDIILNYDEPVYVEGNLIAGGRIFSKSTIFVDGALVSGGNIECAGDIIAAGLILTTDDYFKNVTAGKKMIDSYDDAMNYFGNISGNKVISFTGIDSFGSILGNEVVSFGGISSYMDIKALTKVCSLGDICAREISAPEVICNNKVTTDNNLEKNKIMGKRI